MKDITYYLLAFNTIIYFIYTVGFIKQIIYDYNFNAARFIGSLFAAANIIGLFILLGGRLWI